MKKALIIAYNDLNNSGVPNVIYQTIKALHTEYAFDILIFKDDEYNYQKLLKEGIEVNLIKYKEEKPKGKIARLFWWIHKMPKQHYLFMKQLLKENDYSVIHSFKEYYSWPFFKAASDAGIQRRIFHSNVDLKRDLKSKHKLLNARNLRLSIKYASSLVGVSKLCCERSFGKKNYFVLHNCYDQDRFKFSDAVELSDYDLVISQVGTFNENKNQLFSLKITEKIKGKYPDVKLNLLGGDSESPYCQKLRDYIQLHNLEENISLIDKCQNVEDYYKNSSFIIIPSYSEGFSLVAIEAQACGIGVFASSCVPAEVNVGGVRFIDLDKGPEYWADEICKTFEKQKNTRKQYDLSPFSFERFKKDLEQIYDGK